MGKEREADFYIGTFVPKLSYHKMAFQYLEDVPFNETIVELGCGCGYLAELLTGRAYIGIDFSTAVLEKAKERVGDMTFILADLRESRNFEIYKAFRVFVLLEVLEHIIADQAIIASISPGSRVVFSVPSYDSAGHVRCFKNQNEVKERYREWLDFDEVNILPVPLDNRKLFIFKARRR